MMVAKIMMALLRRVFSFLLRRGSADPAKIAARAYYLLLVLLVFLVLFFVHFGKFWYKHFCWGLLCLSLPICASPSII